MLVVGYPYNEDGSPGSLARRCRAIRERPGAAFGTDGGARGRALFFPGSERGAEAAPRRSGPGAGACSAPTSTASQPPSFSSAGCAARAEAACGEQWTADHDQPTAQRRLPAAPDHARWAARALRSKRCWITRSATCARSASAHPANRALDGLTIGNLFTEPSTRTRVSFELAGRRLGAAVVNIEVQLSSRVKGETMLDTIYTLESVHFDAFVIRDAETGRDRTRGRARGPARQRVLGGRGAPLAPDAGAARCPDRAPTQGRTLREAVPGDRRRHPPLARRALGL